ncbi:MAG: Wzz/FepE/Etk N-terminal domain-containing protein, partial [candidate division WOR-3 bacterium]
METLIEYLKIIIKYRKVFYRVTAGFIAFSIILSLIVPNKYRATAQLLPPVEETDLLGLSSVLQSLGGATQMRSLARMAGMAGIAPTTLETMRAILL